MALEKDTKIGLTVQPMGNSEGVVIPAEWRERLGVEKGELVDAEADLEEGTVTYHLCD